MSSTKKVILGILTALPLALWVGYFGMFFRMFSRSFTENGPVGGPEEIFSLMSTIMTIVAVAVLFHIGLLIYYIIDITNNKKFEDPKHSNNKLIWILVVIFAGTIGMLAYFFVEVKPLTL